MKFRELFNLSRRDTNDAMWGKTEFEENRVRNSGFYEEKGFLRKEKVFKGKRVIGRDRAINGGVYLGGAGGEAIVVDDTEDELLARVYQELLRRRQESMKHGTTFKEGILEEVFKLVCEVIPYDFSRLNYYAEQMSEPDIMMPLSHFFGGGVCRHQALLTGYLLETLSKEGYVGGRVSVDANYIPDRGGHTWTRYTNSAGEVFILDPAQQYIGTLKEMTQEQERWFYERPEDQNQMLNLKMKVKRLLSASMRRRSKR